MRSATAEGLSPASSSRAFSSGSPAAATRSYVAHRRSVNRSQPPLMLMKIPAQSFLKTSSGKSASARFQYVICGAIASTRRSYPAASREAAPPYEAPVMPTRGSPSPSRRTSGRVASQSISRETSAISPLGSLSPILPLDLPKPRADQVRTAYPSRARSSACSRTSLLLPPKPCPMRTAGRLAEASPAVKYEVSIFAPPVSTTRSARRTAGASSEATAVHVPAPASTTTAAAAASSRRGPRRTGNLGLGSRRSMPSTVRARTDNRGSRRVEPACLPRE